MISPEYYRDARLTARDHIEGVILERTGHSACIFVIRVRCYLGPSFTFKLISVQAINGTPGNPSMPTGMVFKPGASLRPSWMVIPLQLHGSRLSS
jgi:hypothetical protein